MRAELRGIHKRFGGVEALRGADFEVAPGEIHALLGENGAGKTTLVRVLYGWVRPDRGDVLLDGQPTEIRGPRHALSLGIGLVHQHFMGIPTLTVAENLLLGAEAPVWLSRRELCARAQRALEQHGLDLDPGLPAARLAVAQQQRLEIVRALTRGVRLLVLDEPTAVLAPSEVDALLELLAQLRGEGRSIVFISHKLEEITQLCDRVTVLRAGKTAGTRAAAGVDAAELGRWMLGEAFRARPARAARVEPGPVALRMSELRAPGLRRIEAEVRAGEVLAITGIDGNGQDPLEELLAGVRTPSAGRLEVLRPPLALLPGDRQRTGAVLDLPLEENLVLCDAARGGTPPVFRWGVVRPEVRRELAARTIARFGIRAAPETPVRALSGGNQQKVCVARAFQEEPGVLAAVNPTRGLDVAASATVRDEIRAHARRGGAVLLLSTDLDEALELGDRIAVLFRGELLAVEPEYRSRERIGALMLGESGA